MYDGARGRHSIFVFTGVISSSLFSLLTPAGRQVSQRLAEEARKRERFEELKQHLEQEQEVVMCVCVWRFVLCAQIEVMLKSKS